MGRRGRDHMVVGFTTTYAISANHHWCCELESRTWRGVQHYVIKVCQWLATGRWFSPGPPVSSTNKTDRHDIIEILLKVLLNTIKQTNKQNRAVNINKTILNQKTLMLVKPNRRSIVDGVFWECHAPCKWKMTFFRLTQCCFSELKLDVLV
jgi:hypothetical protein